MSSKIKIHKDYQKIFEFAFKQADKKWTYSNKCKLERDDKGYYLAYTNTFILVRVELDDWTEEIKKAIDDGICQFEIEMYKKGELIISPLTTYYIKYENIMDTEWVFENKDVENIMNLNFVLGRVCELYITPFVLKIFSNTNTSLSPLLRYVSMSKDGLCKFSVGELNKESYILIMGIKPDMTSFQLLLSVQK